MKDYWKELSLSETWSKRERFNYILNYLEGKISSNNNNEPEPQEPETPLEPEEPAVTTAVINVSIKDNEDNGINGATVEVTKDNNVLFSNHTGSAGGCILRDVPVGDYLMHTHADGYIDSYDDFTVIDGENNFSIVLEEESDNSS